MPILDNQLKSPSPLLLSAQDAVTPLSEAEAIDLVNTCFASATERDIYTMDSVQQAFSPFDFGDAPVNLEFFFSMFRIFNKFQGHLIEHFVGEPTNVCSFCVIIHVFSWS